MSKWEDALWAELKDMTPSQRFIATGEWISYITQELLTRLGRERRLAALEALEREGMDAVSFAETVGSRSTTVSRLLEEARVIVRQEQQE